MSDIKMKVINNNLQKRFDKTLDDVADKIACALHTQTNFCYNTPDVKYILLYYKPVTVTKDFVIPGAWLYIKCHSNPDTPKVYRRVDCLDIHEDMLTIYRIMLDDIGRSEITFNSGDFEL